MNRNKAGMSLSLGGRMHNRSVSTSTVGAALRRGVFMFANPAAPEPASLALAAVGVTGPSMA
jgi:hypothetical protein